MEKILNALNDAQRAPVLHKDGPLMVIAGAGSGKTRVLTYRIAYLMAQGVDAFSILALTFTNKAAREMKSRIADLVGNQEARNLWMGTFHSVFAKILRFEADKLGYPSHFTIYDTQDSQSVIRAIIKDLRLDKDVYKYKQVFSRISSYKNNLITVQAYFNNPELLEADTAARMPQLGNIYKAYVDRCFKAGAMDFDDLLLKTNELLTRFPKVLAKYQDRFRYILVDEYQDTNHSQYLIVKALSDRFQNICVVGDDAQSIYAFRGANIRNIFNFQKDYHDVSVYRLEQNYRSTQHIVKAANSIIEKNTQRLEKVVWTANSPGDKIKVHGSMTDADEGRFIARSIFENKMNLQKHPKDFAVLYRTNAQSRAIEDALRKRDIPYRIFGGLSFYQRKEIKDVLAYLRLVINPLDEEALRRVINYPARGIGQTTISHLTVAAQTHNKALFEILEAIDSIPIAINARARTKLKDFYALIKSFQVLNQSMNAFEITEHVAKKTGLLAELRKDGTPEGITRIENVEELLNGVRDFVEGQTEVADAQGTLTEFLEDVALATDLDTDTTDTNRVALMTIHLAKGLEFPFVYIVGLEEDLFPSIMSMETRQDLEEERRLFYVALTRAETQAYLTYAHTRYRWGKLIDSNPSRFIEEIDDTYLEYLTPKPNEDVNQHGHMQDFVFPNQKGFQQQTQKPQTWVKKPSGVPLQNLKRVQATSQASINTELKNLQEGQRVMHDRFGKGTVIKLEGHAQDLKAEIKFDVSGTKKILLRFAKLELID